MNIFTGCSNAVIKVQHLQTIEDIILKLLEESNTLKTTVEDVQNIIMEIQSMLDLLLISIRSTKQNIENMCGNIKPKAYDNEATDKMCIKISNNTQSTTPK